MEHSAPLTRERPPKSGARIRHRNSRLAGFLSQQLELFGGYAKAAAFLSDGNEQPSVQRPFPLPVEDLESFDGLECFPVDADWAISGAYEVTEAHNVQVPSTAGMENPYTKVGIATIAVADVSYRLTVLDDGDTFIPFRDGTCGEGTYEGERHVGISRRSGSSVKMDFNLVRNPWCMYDEEFICPLPPVENWMAVSVRAGEKMY